jgi:murein DD-endopeptidase MepM/ murein hydrolase activator NlpD
VRDYASRNYPYGSTGGGQFQTHHGIDIQNPLGTAVLAAASGWVIYAGSDSITQFGPLTDFYGNLVVIEHDQRAPTGEPLYTLYGHLSRVDVAAGQRIELQQRIGQVGATGVALGSHLHLEVRIGNPYDYARTYNPDLWIRPWPTFGTLAGRITDAYGNPLHDVAITIQSATGPSRMTYSYADDTVNSDPYYGEHFTHGDLPEGEYTVLVRKQGVLRFKGTVTIVAGQTNWIDIRLN